MYMCMDNCLQLSKDHKNKIFFDKLVHEFSMKFTLFGKSLKNTQFSWLKEVICV